ncbi:hypothetical protein AVEN_73321-1 [Araneus ventricosus]|uniref:Transposon Ty3-I Gag-Pol polyprotein n=1 Tax=Araneus ventricosus TaxID=182803 RepID=A0A4Y2H696_ARAVE|nr:hypothetical protein AVEN_73321-1 [Araneus ventricosus]
MEIVGPRTTRRNSSRHIFVHKDLENCSHVFQRIDRVKKQLESPYELSISAANPKTKFPELFKGLGVMKGYYSIKFKPGAIPFAITSPRRVPIPLLKQTKAELERMLEEKVITPVLKPTEWCAPVVIVPICDGNVRICVDLIELNKNVMRNTL